MARMRRLSMRVPLRLRLARLRRLPVRRLWLLLAVGTLPRLLKGTLRPEHNKSPSEHCNWPGPNSASCAHRNGGQLVFAPVLSASQ